MAYGDIGGPVTELIVTCQTPNSGSVAIARGDALTLTADYTADNKTNDEDPIFGQAMADTDQNAKPFPVKVRGICVFTYTGAAPPVDGETGIVASATDGTVKAPASGTGHGINVKVDTSANEVHVLL